MTYNVFGGTFSLTHGVHHGLTQSISAGLTHKRSKRALRAPSGKGAPRKSG